MEKSVSKIDYSSRNIQYSRINETTTSLHFQNCFHILVVEKGNVIITINGNKNDLKEGEIAVIDCFDSYTYRHFRGSYSNILTIPLNYLQHYSSVMNNKTIENNHITDRRKIRSIQRRIEDLLENIEENELVIQGYVELLLGIIIKNNIIAKNKKSISEIRRSIAIYVENNYKKQHLNGDSIAEYLGYTPNYFSHLFPRVFDSNISEYINMVRCRHAIDMFVNDATMTLDDVIEKVGFSSQRSFYRSFSKIYNEPPKKYLNKIRQESIK